MRGRIIDAKETENYIVVSIETDGILGYEIEIIPKPKGVLHEKEKMQ